MANCSDFSHQSPKEVVMIRPGFFTFDYDTKDSNAFQNELSDENIDEKRIHLDALEEVSEILDHFTVYKVF